MAAVRLWGTLLTGMMSSGKSLTGSAGGGVTEVYKTEFSMHQVSYYFMVWSSLTLGGIMVIEQYFGRRIFCFMPANNTQPATAIGEYCWTHGYFEKPHTSMEYYLPDEKLILQSFVYFFIRAAVFVVPHMIWQFKYEAWIVAVIKSSVGLVRNLQHLWLQFSEIADKAYSDQNDLSTTEAPACSSAKTSPLPNQHNMYQNNNFPHSHQRNQQHNFNTYTVNQQGTSNPVNNNSVESIRKDKLYKTYSAVLAMTRDVVQITKKQVPHYTGVTYFIIGRMVYDLLVLLMYSAMDFTIFRITNKYDSTDYYCKLPGNTEEIRCMMPVMSFQWYASLLSMITSFLMLILMILYTCRLLIMLCSSSTKDTFLDHIPFSETVADTTWNSCMDRKTYKVLSKCLLQNISILSPLNFLESFVDHMKENHEVGEDLLSRTDRDGIQMLQMRQIIGYNDETTDGDDALWRLMGK